MSSCRATNGNASSSSRCSAWATGSGCTSFVDLGKQFAIEFDGHDHHSSKADRTKDAARDRALLALGWRMVRFTGSEVWRDPEGCAGALCGVLGLEVAPRIAPPPIVTVESVQRTKSGVKIAEAIGRAIAAFPSVANDPALRAYLEGGRLARVARGVTEAGQYANATEALGEALANLRKLAALDRADANDAARAALVDGDVEAENALLREVSRRSREKLGLEAQ